MTQSNYISQCDEERFLNRKKRTKHRVVHSEFIFVHTQRMKKWRQRR